MVKRSQSRSRRNHAGLSVSNMSGAVEAAEVRILLSAGAIDGSGNNLANPAWGSAGEDLIRLANAEYADGVSAVGGEDRPSARVISNAVADSGGEDVISDRLMSAMIYAWGQFIDHDMTLTESGTTERMSIPVPKGDPSFDPFSTGTKTINTMRSGFDGLTGTTTSNPRQQVNLVTAFLDGSMIYGSDTATATALRTLQGGRLKTSAGNLLPLNNDATFPDGPLEMANANPTVSSDELFAAGDVRANENVELTALQTLFVREHNSQAGRIFAANRLLSDEQVYQKSRAIVIAELQAITYNEWLPSLLGQGTIDRYTGYKPTVNAEISNEFATGAFRFGHSLLGDDVEFLDNNGLSVHDEVALRDAFFNPDLLRETGIDSILKYLSADPASEIDTEVVDSVRNFLFGPPGAGGLDLASLNIQRGRDHGLADYNTVRESMGLPRVTSFSDITGDAELQSELKALYGSVDNIDLWVGGLAEDHVPGSSLGQTFQAIVVDQFERLRDGDRYWYQNQFKGDELARLQRTSLSDIIKRNTTLTSVQHNAFFFKAGISGTVSQDLNRDGVVSRNEPPLANATVQLINTEDRSVVATSKTDRRGSFSFNVEDGLRTGVYQVRINKPDGTTLVTSGNVAIRSGDDFKTVNLAVPLPQPPKPAPQPGKLQPQGSKKDGAGAVTPPPTPSLSAGMTPIGATSVRSLTPRNESAMTQTVATAARPQSVTDRQRQSATPLQGAPTATSAAAGSTFVVAASTAVGLNSRLIDELFSVLPSGLL